MHPTESTSRRMLPPGEYDIEDIDKISFAHERCLLPDYFGPCPYFQLTQATCCSVSIRFLCIFSSFLNPLTAAVVIWVQL